MAEDAFELSFFYEWIKHDVDVKTLSAVATPFVFFCANITTAEDGKILWILEELLADLVFVHTTQKAKIENLVCEVIIGVILEISFELEALGILVIDVCTSNIALVGASFIGNRNVFLVVEIGHNERGKSERR